MNKIDKLSPLELDIQSPVKINEWIDINSDKAKEIDNDYFLTKKMLKIGSEDGWMFVDFFGRIWGWNKEKDIYFPFHFENGSKLIGYKQSILAAN